MDTDTRPQPYVTQCVACSRKVEWQLRTKEEAIREASSEDWSRLGDDWLCPDHTTFVIHGVCKGAMTLGAAG